MPKSRNSGQWHEVLTPEGELREHYAAVYDTLKGQGAVALRSLEDQMSATMREMGVTFRLLRSQPWGRQPWKCDLLPQVIATAEWEFLVRGIRQRLRAWEAFLADVYGPREILRAGIIPVQAVLGSPNYQHAAIGIPRSRDAFLHLSGICFVRNAKGVPQVKQHHFAHATGISYMLQNRRALARVVPDLFETVPVQSLAEISVLILEQLRETAPVTNGEPNVVLLSEGEGNAVASEQSFLARRMGIPMVQGGDLLVLDDCVYLKTVRGLERVHVIFNYVADQWLDPLVFRRDSFLGIPGLVHSLRKGSVSLVNAVGAQLADDRSLLAFSSQIVKFYLAEAPLLQTVPTLWLGDIDQREYALENLDKWRVRAMSREWGRGLREPLLRDTESLRKMVRQNGANWIAQPREPGAVTACFEDGRTVEHPYDHIVFGIRTGADFGVLPGALTRVHAKGEAASEASGDWTSKDTWVVSGGEQSVPLPKLRRRASESPVPARQVTSRVAESFYWMGRYLERAQHQAYLISVIETLETEELNSAERRHYRPMWNRLLPPLEKSAGTSRRSIANRVDRYRLVLLPEPGSVFRTFMRAATNADAVQDSLSPEAAATLNELQARFHKTRFRENLSEAEVVKVTRRMSDAVAQFVPQFFAVAANTMLADEGWRFCEIGKMLERAIITANSVVSIVGTLSAERRVSTPHASEIELSAFLRLLATRDAYRRIYQMRAEPKHVLELLWQHPQVPRSVIHCLEYCLEQLYRSVARSTTSGAGAPVVFEALIRRIQRIEWAAYVPAPADEDRPAQPAGTRMGAKAPELGPLLRELLGEVSDLHTVISDSFLNHQAHISEVSQPLLRGMGI